MSDIEQIARETIELDAKAKNVTWLDEAGAINAVYSHARHNCTKLARAVIIMKEALDKMNRPYQGLETLDYQSRIMEICDVTNKIIKNALAEVEKL